MNMSLYWRVAFYGKLHLLSLLCFGKIVSQALFEERQLYNDICYLFIKHE